LLRKKAIVLVCTLIVLMLIPISVLAEGARPFTGAYLKDTIRSGNGGLTIINGNPQIDAVAVLVMNTADKLHMLAIYIRSKESYTYSGVADGSYNMYFETGNNWNSSSDKFTDKGGFYRLNRSLPFETTYKPRPNGVEHSSSIWTIALGSAAPNANESVQKVSVNEDDFPALK
jgi:hypothetical protein